MNFYWYDHHASFPVGQSKIPGYAKPLQVDRDGSGGGIKVFVRKDNPVKVFIYSTADKPIEFFL